MRDPFRYFNSSPEVIRLTVILYIRHPGPSRFQSRGGDVYVHL